MQPKNFLQPKNKAHERVPGMYKYVYINVIYWISPPPRIRDSVAKNVIHHPGNDPGLWAWAKLDLLYLGFGKKKAYILHMVICGGLAMVQSVKL